MSRLTYISRNYKDTGYGGGKARTDVERILDSMGAVNLGNRRSFRRSKVTDFFMNLVGIARFMARVRPGDVVVLQYPVKKYYRVICRWARLRKARTVTLVHDLGAFRRHRLTVEQEIAKLSLTDSIIAANASAIEWLRSHGCRVPLTEHVAWDFLSDATAPEASSAPLSCAYIGDLTPGSNAFLYKLPPALELHLYGHGAPASCSRMPGVTCHGHGEADRLIAEAAGRYGLIWYGPSLTEHTGFIGNYIKICNPHKLALYMRAGKPVVVWAEAAAGAFVEREGVGLTVDNLENLDARLAEVTEADYARMLANVRRVGALMARGHYFRSALTRAVAALEA